MPTTKSEEENPSKDENLSSVFTFDKSHLANTVLKNSNVTCYPKFSDD